MNYKLEKFWNKKEWLIFGVYVNMNYKLEKFWNILCLPAHKPNFKWTINLKSFEIKVATADPNSAINEL